MDSSEVRGPDEAELDQNGVLLYALEQYVRWTGDVSMIAEHWARVAAVAEYPLRPRVRAPGERTPREFARVLGTAPDPRNHARDGTGAPGVRADRVAGGGQAGGRHAAAGAGGALGVERRTPTGGDAVASAMRLRARGRPGEAPEPRRHGPGPDRAGVWIDHSARSAAPAPGRALAEPGHVRHAAGRLPVPRTGLGAGPPDARQRRAPVEPGVADGRVRPVPCLVRAGFAWRLAVRFDVRRAGGRRGGDARAGMEGAPLAGYGHGRRGRFVARVLRTAVVAALPAGGDRPVDLVGGARASGRARARRATADRRSARRCRRLLPGLDHASCPFADGRRGAHVCTCAARPQGRRPPGPASAGSSWRSAPRARSTCPAPRTSATTSTSTSSFRANDAACLTRRSSSSATRTSTPSGCGSGRRAWRRRSTFRAAADLCEEFDGFVFCHNEALLYEWVEEYEPALFARIQRARPRRAAGTSWAAGTCSRTATCRAASRSSGRSSSASATSWRSSASSRASAVNLDPFGHTRGLVQILAKAGYDGLSLLPARSRLARAAGGRLRVGRLRRVHGAGSSRVGALQLRARDRPAPRWGAGWSRTTDRSARAAALGRRQPRRRPVAPGPAGAGRESSMIAK